MRRIIAVIMLITVLCSCTEKYPEHLSEEALSQLRESYRYYDEVNPLIDMVQPELQDYMDQSEAYVVGHFTEVGNPQYQNSWRYYPGTFVIDEVVNDPVFDLKKGDAIVIRMADYEYEYGMELPGENQYLIPLAAAEEEYTSNRYAWYYVTPDAYVVSITSFGDLDDYSGWSLEEFGDFLKEPKE